MDRAMRRVALAVLGGGVIGLAGMAHGQGRLPDPPAGKDPRQAERIDNYDAWVEAYTRSGRPRMLFYTDIVTKEGVAAGADLGNVARLGNRLEEYFRNPEVILINPGAQAALTAQQVEQLHRNDEAAAAKIVGESMKSDVVVYVRLIEQQHRGDGSTYVGTYTIADLRQGTTLGKHSWDMTPDPREGQYTSPRMGEYAKAIARRVAQQYCEAYPGGGEAARGGAPAPGTTVVVESPKGTVTVSSPGGEAGARPVPAPAPSGAMRRFTLRLVGEYEEETLADFREAMRSIPGVRGDSVLLRGEEKSSATSVVTFECMYAGDALDLRTQVRRAAASQMGIEASVLGAREGSIELRLNPGTLSVRERALSGGAPTNRNADERAMLAYRYDKVGRPTIAIMMNQAVVADEAPIEVDAAPGGGNTALQQGDGVNIVIGDRVGVSGDGRAILDPFAQKVAERELRDVRKERRQDAVIDTMYFENKIAERLVQLGLRPKDVSGVQAEMSQELSSRQWKDRELAFALAKKGGADVAMSGVGRLVRDRATQKPMRLTFTVRAYQVGDGVLIGSASVSRDVSDGLQTYDQVLDQMAADATGRMVAQMSDAWARAGKASASEEKR